MSDIDHVPIRPNINYQRASSTGFKQPVNKKTQNNFDNKEASIFADSTDPDILQFIKRTPNALSLDSVPTKEERISKGVGELREKEKSQKVEQNSTEKKIQEEEIKTKSSGWIIIVLAVIVIILILIIVYYVLNYNNIITPAAIIQDNVVKPSSFQNIMNKDQLSHNIRMAPIQMDSMKNNSVNDYINSKPVKPKDYVEPTKSDLDSVLNRLSAKSDSNSDSIKNKQNQPKENQNIDTSKNTSRQVKGKEVAKKVRFYDNEQKNKIEEIHDDEDDKNTEGSVIVIDTIDYNVGDEMDETASRVMSEDDMYDELKNLVMEDSGDDRIDPQISEEFLDQTDF